MMRFDMWSKKFGFLVSESITLPFALFSKTIGLQLQFMGVIFVIGLVVMFMLLGGISGINEVIEAIQQSRQVNIEPSIGLIGVLVIFSSYALVFLMIIAYVVYVMRLVAGEQNESSFLPALAFNRNTLLTLWAYIKILLIELLILLPVIIVGALGVMSSPVNEENVRVVPESVGALTILLGVIAYIVIVYIGPKLLPVISSAALGDGTSLSKAWSISKGYWWLTVISQLVIILLGVLGAFAFFFLMGITLIPIAYFLSFLPPMLLMIPFLFFYGVMFFSFLTVFSGFLAKLYLLQTNRVELRDAEIKSK